MRKMFLWTMLLALALAFPLSTMAEVSVGIGISLPPLVVFASPPELVVIPETYVYVVPGSDVDIFFYNGWWWRPWEGRWYRSRYYDSGWGYYQRVPSFYSRVPSGWRNDYRDRRWRGQEWNHRPIPHNQLQKSWSYWQKNNHWEKQQTWGVKGLKPRPGPQQQSKGIQQRSPGKHMGDGDKSLKPRPESRKVQPQPKQPPHRDAPQQAKPHQEKPQRGEEDRQDRR